MIMNMFFSSIKHNTVNHIRLYLASFLLFPGPFCLRTDSRVSQLQIPVIYQDWRHAGGRPLPEGVGRQQQWHPEAAEVEQLSSPLPSRSLNFSKMFCSQKIRFCDLGLSYWDLVDVLLSFLRDPVSGRPVPRPQGAGAELSPPQRRTAPRSVLWKTCPLGALAHRCCERKPRADALSQHQKEQLGRLGLPLAQGQHRYVLLPL